MTEIAFHFNAPDKAGYGCRLLRKAVATGARVVVTGPPEVLRPLDQALWTFSALDFLPHCQAGSDSSMVAASPVVLAEAHALGDFQNTHHPVLVNLGPGLPAGFERFERLIEVVTGDEEDRQLARRRWKHYADRGYSILRHDLAGKAGGSA